MRKNVIAATQGQYHADGDEEKSWDKVTGDGLVQGSIPSMVVL